MQDGAIIDALGGLQVIHVPGHTPGSIALYQAEQRILFCGDAIFYYGSSSDLGRIALPPRIFSVDPDQAATSARKLAALPVGWALLLRRVWRTRFVERLLSP